MPPVPTRPARLRPPRRPASGPPGRPTRSASAPLLALSAVAVLVLAGILIAFAGGSTSSGGSSPDANQAADGTRALTNGDGGSEAEEGRAPADPRPATPQAVIARVRASVLLVLAKLPDGVSSGTGFVAQSGRVGTCAHVVANAEMIVLISVDGRRFPATVEATDSVNDVAVLRCEGTLPSPLALGNSDKAEDGDEIAVTGYPAFFKFLGLDYQPTPSTSRGTISAHRTHRDASGVTVEQLQTDASMTHGNSGGPVYSIQSGQVLGLAAAGLSQETGLNFASTVNALRKLLH